MATYFTMLRLFTTVVIFTVAQAMSALTTEQPPPPPTTEPQLPPDTTRMTTPMMTTAPGGCVTRKGDQLAVGQSKQYTSELSCEIYTCEKPGEVSTMIGDCFFPPRCVDPVRRHGACCRSCPNGENCKLPSGKVIRAGLNVTYNGVQCRCPKQDWNNMQQDPTKAECDESTRGCELPDGTILAGLKPWDEYKPDPCTFCTCGDDFKMACAVAGCARPPCDNPVVPEGECCPQCPLEEYDDPVVPEGECCPQCPPCEDSSNQCRYWASNAECQTNSVWMRENCKKSCAVCDAECVDTDQHCKWWSEQGYCDSNPVWMRDNCPVSCDACTPRAATPPSPPTTTPSPPTTTPFITTTPGGCRTFHGDQLYPGQEKTYYDDGSCTVCSCSEGGEASCLVGDCQVPMCVDAFKPSGACCATCPKGRNCRIPSTGEVISAGLPVYRNGMRCECPPQSYDLPGVQRPEHYTAVCGAATTTPPTTMPTTFIPYYGPNFT